MAKQPGEQSKASTRQRILDAAIKRFCTHSYEATGLRDIAADVGLDVAYVHRSFGSKERLFEEAVRAAIVPQRFLDGPVDDLPRTLAKQVLAHRGPDEPAPLDIVVRSLSSPDAGRVLRETILKDFIGSLAEKTGEPVDARFAAITAFLSGLGIIRNVLQIHLLAEGEGGDLEALIASAIEAMLRAIPAASDGRDPEDRAREKSRPAQLEGGGERD